MVIVNTLTEGGRVKNSYQWYGRKGRYYWYDLDEGAEVTEPIYFEPGEAFWIQCDVDDDEVKGLITFPGVELN